VPIEPALIREERADDQSASGEGDRKLSHDTSLRGAGRSRRPRWRDTHAQGSEDMLSTSTVETYAIRDSFTAVVSASPDRSRRQQRFRA
jgi:hypothetical protein